MRAEEMRGTYRSQLSECGPAVTGGGDNREWTAVSGPMSGPMNGCLQSEEFVGGTGEPELGREV